MALLSELDWVVVLAVGAFLLFGQGSGTALRQVGRWYGRAMRLKQELLAEFTAAADLPPPVPGRPTSIRAALLQSEPAGRGSGIPIAVTAPPAAAYAAPTAAAYAGAIGSGTWSMARPGPELEALR